MKKVYRAPKATEVQGKVSGDGSTYTLTVPAYMYWRQGDVDDLFKRGH